MKYRLIVFDLDGTIIDMDSAWYMLHEFFGASEHPDKLEAEKRFMSGHIDYQEWAERDIEVMKKHGANRENMKEALQNVKLIEGALETIQTLKKRGYNIGLVSDSLDFVLETLIPDYKNMFDYILINRLSFDKNGKILKTETTRFNFQNKSAGLKNICGQEGIETSECVFVGDHDNDVEIAKLAGFSIAFNSKSRKLNEIADAVIEKKDLREILKYL